LNSTNLETSALDLENLAASVPQALDFVASSNDRLQFTIFLGLALNALLIFGVGTTMEVGDKLAPTLNITLATHKSVKEPEKADFIAQHNQEASGTEQDIKELTTQKNTEIADVHIREVNPSPEIKATQHNDAELRVLTTQGKSDRSIHETDLNDLGEVEENVDGEDRDIPFINPEIASLRAKLDRLKQDLAKQPRIRRLTSVSAKASYDAAYLNMWTQKIESVGNKHFPAAALRDGIFGNLRMSVLLRPDGSVEFIEVLQSSGHPILDDAAIQIVKLSSPFPRFPKEIIRNTDKLEIIRTWRFEITGLSTSN